MGDRKLEAYATHFSNGAYMTAGSATNALQRSGTQDGPQMDGLRLIA